jgi:hypothetical protein
MLPYFILVYRIILPEHCQLPNLDRVEIMNTNLKTYKPR